MEEVSSPPGQQLKRELLSIPDAEEFGRGDRGCGGDSGPCPIMEANTKKPVTVLDTTEDQRIV